MGGRNNSEPHERVQLGDMQAGQDRIRINRVQYKADQPATVDVRRWWFDENAGTDGDYAPGKGLTVPLNKWDQFVKMVNDADIALKERQASEKAKPPTGNVVSLI